MFLRDIGSYKSHTASHPRRRHSFFPFSFRIALSAIQTEWNQHNIWRMVSSGLLRCVAFVRTDVSEVLTRATRHNNPEDTILHSHRRENLKSYSIIYLLHSFINNKLSIRSHDCLCGLVIKVPRYISRGLGFDPGLERAPQFVSITEELLEWKVVALG
jgi:hypothetical protein